MSKMDRRLRRQLRIAEQVLALLPFRRGPMRLELARIRAQMPGMQTPERWHLPSRDRTPGSRF